MTIDRFAIVGLGLTDQGSVPGVSALEFKTESLRAALRDAGLTAADIDGYIYQPGVADKGQGHGGELVRRLGMAPNFVWSVQGGGTSAVSAIQAACGAIAAGMATAVAVGYGDDLRSSSTLVGEGAGMRGDPSAAYGMFSPGADHALAARRHMHLYGTTREQLGSVALSAREYAALRPDAFRHGRALTMEDYLAAAPVATPFTKHDYCLTADGGTTVIVTSAERAKDLPSVPVHISGIGLSGSYDLVHERRQYERLGAQKAAENAFGSAGVDPSDIDVAQLYDCFTITVIMALEAYGFCAPGEGGPLVASGAIGPRGSIPVNTGGGELAWGYQQGFTPLAEGVRQIRGLAAATQVANAQHCLVTGHGGVAQSLGHMDYLEAAMILSKESR